MNVLTPSISPTEVHHLLSPVGLHAEFNTNGNLRRLMLDKLCVNLFTPNGLEEGSTALVLRCRQGGEVVGALNLMSPSSGAQWRLEGGQWQVRGHWGELRYCAWLQLSASDSVWFWHVAVHNCGTAALTVDMLLLQDVALAPYGTIRVNEYYISQYLDHTALAHAARGVMLATRQNLADSQGRNPWLLTGSLRCAVSYATDALQVVGRDARNGASPLYATQDLPGVRLQHEHAMLALQDEPCELAAGSRAHFGFFSGVQTHHAAASGDSDLACADKWMALPEAKPPVWPHAPEPVVAAWMQSFPSAFAQAPVLPIQRADESALSSHFPGAWRHRERDANGTLLSFFTPDGEHVVLHEKERQVLRPHGHMLRSGNHLVPNEQGLTSTCWMNGVFHSMVTEGHVSANRLLSTVRSYLGLNRSAGQRIFVSIGGQWHRLGLPSVFAMANNQCRWLYQYDQGLVEVRATAMADRQVLELQVAVLAGPACTFLVSHHIAVQGDDGQDPSLPLVTVLDSGGVRISPAPGSEMHDRFPSGGFRIEPAPDSRAVVDGFGGDGFLYADGASRQQPMVCMRTLPCHGFTLCITSQLVDTVQAVPAHMPGLEVLRLPRLDLKDAYGEAVDVSALADLLPWLQNNALVHYLSPRGLEQYTGGGWGTRDVSQGPVELLLAHDCLPPVRDLLLRVFQAQQTDGDWPQWFMFFERDRLNRAADSHGDIVFWPIVALGQYLLASGDRSLLDEVVPFFCAGDASSAEHATVWQHVQRAFGVIAHRRIPGTHLAAYGHGDWNDSLQPADPHLRDFMCSAWTVTLHYQMLATLGQALKQIGREADADPLAQEAAKVMADFQRLLMPDGVLTGYALFDTPDACRYLLHPRDDRTGAHYSLLPMVHAVINEMLDQDQAALHLGLVATYLQGPDGARLFDKPLAYRGGLQTLFQRAETSSFFGREIGLMYTHAHLRYAEALAHYGDAQAFFDALCLINPIGMQCWIPSSRLRQSNCYYSSSDAEFQDRYDSIKNYELFLVGDIGSEGGWRVYSSGAGIALSLVIRNLLGLRTHHAFLDFDPVMPGGLNGLVAHTDVDGYALEIHYRVGWQGCGVQQLVLNGQPMPYARLANRYRVGAARVQRGAWKAALDGRTEKNVLEIVLG